ncbi:acid-sensing (proton-gated) ion channel [Chamberlinius hualienensis]
MQTMDVFLEAENLTKKNEMEILSQFAQLNLTERINYAESPIFKINLLLNTGIRDTSDVTDITKWTDYVSNNLYYGNCLTLNFERANRINKKPVEGMRVSIKLLIPPFIQVDSPNKHFTMVIHEPYTEPVFDSKNIIKLWLNTKTKITATKNNYIREHNCLKMEKFNISRVGLKATIVDNKYYIETLTYNPQDYLYSVEACMASCLQNMTIKYCQCQLPQFRSNTQLRACTYCRLIPQEELNNLCHCTPPCSYSKYELKTEVVQMLVNEKDEMRRIEAIKQTDTKNPNMAAVYDIKMQEEYAMRQINCEVAVEMASKSTSTSTLHPICKLEFVISQIGGILGTYAGLCIILMVEMLYDYLLLFIKRLHQKSVGTSSISLINRIEKSNLIMKSFWTLILLGGLYKTTEQGCHLFQEYISNPVVIKSQIIHEFEFPSVTICSNNVLRKNASDMLKQRIALGLRRIPSFKQSDGADYAFNWLTKSHRMSIETLVKDCGVKQEQYIKHCHYKQNDKLHTCGLLYETFMGELGNCATFNPGFLNDIPSNTFNPLELLLELQYEAPAYSELFREIGLKVFLHPKGTSSNAIKPMQVLTIVPSFNYTITFSKFVSEEGLFHNQGRLYPSNFILNNTYPDQKIYPELMVFPDCPISCEEVSHTIETFLQIPQVETDNETHESDQDLKIL